VIPGSATEKKREANRLTMSKTANKKIHSFRFTFNIERFRNIPEGWKQVQVQYPAPKNRKATLTAQVCSVVDQFFFFCKTTVTIKFSFVNFICNCQSQSFFSFCGQLDVVKGATLDSLISPVERTYSTSKDKTCDVKFRLLADKKKIAKVCASKSAHFPPPPPPRSKS
jgi:hypothetical protein